MEESPYLQVSETLVERFRNLPFLRSLDQRHIRDILRLSKIRKYQPGEIITEEGTRDCWIFIIIAGEARVLKQGREIARLDHIGDTFGELSMLDGESRSATVQAVSETICLATDQSFIDRLSPQDKPAFYSVFYRLFAEIVANRLRATSRELASVKEELERLKRKEKMGF